MDSKGKQDSGHDSCVVNMGGVQKWQQATNDRKQNAVDAVADFFQIAQYLLKEVNSWLCK